MSECQEVAASMIPGYLLHLQATGVKNSMGVARQYVKANTDEGAVWTDNVAEALYKAV